MLPTLAAAVRQEVRQLWRPCLAMPSLRLGSFHRGLRYRLFPLS